MSFPRTRPWLNTWRREGGGEEGGGSFRWPPVDDEAETKSCYVFKWNFEVLPYRNNFRQWVVDSVVEISLAYHSLK